MSKINKDQTLTKQINRITQTKIINQIIRKMISQMVHIIENLTKIQNKDKI